VKRGGSAFDLVLDELAEIVSGGDTPEDLLEGKELNEEIDRFLHGLPEDKRYMFILRYWYAESISGIAERFKLSENNVSVTLNRIRKQLKRSLSERGYTI
jgi:RNA polymerase sigma-70 factor (ECF subfamily)